MPFKVNTGFLPLPDYPLFVVMHLPTEGGWPSHWVIHCPAFAEEMNKSRKVVMDEARAFAERGVGVLVPDLWGTGDSPGEFSSADWNLWRENLTHILYWLKQQGCGSVTLWGLRLGCLLALDVQNNWQSGWPELVQLILWQPSLNAQQSLTQFLRLRMATGLVAANSIVEAAQAGGGASVEGKRVKTETVKDIRQRFSEGETLEVAGYPLSPALVSQLDAVVLDHLMPCAPVVWLEVKSQSGGQLSFVSKKLIEAWKDKQIDVDAQIIAGEPFWATQELAHAPELIRVTCETLRTENTVSTDIQDGGGLGQEADEQSVLSYREQPMMPYEEKRSAAAPVRELDPYVEKRLTSYREVIVASQGIENQEVDVKGQQVKGGEVVGGAVVGEEIVGESLEAQYGNVGAVTEEPLQFYCEGSHLYGVLHLPEGEPKQGVILIVGGPQYRVGSHRQFVQLARSLSRAGIAVLRFDYRGMGDSEGAFEGFEDIEPDIAAAVDAFEHRLPQLQSMVLWGLCDGATAAAGYAYKDARIDGLVLLNPWVRSEAGEAKAYLRHYYLQRLMQPELWKKIGRGRFNVRDSLGSLFGALKRSTTSGQSSTAEANKGDSESRSRGANKADLVSQLTHGLQHFTGRVLIILSGADLTAAEFKDAIRRSRPLNRVISQPQYQMEHLPDSDHTFSRKVWKDRVANWTTEWMQSW
ncbi:hydrolase 1, exosortase A system-associated [Pseudomaricurvus sp.]|uniref:hydrolase 1, exosortase A system-associated n=1 Tax=Pseudomaricurvus sp. TaxID=2004510 RepID=UPI003F6C0A48